MILVSFKDETNQSYALWNLNQLVSISECGLSSAGNVSLRFRDGAHILARKDRIFDVLQEAKVTVIS